MEQSSLQCGNSHAHIVNVSTSLRRTDAYEKAPSERVSTLLSKVSNQVVIISAFTSRRQIAVASSRRPIHSDRPSVMSAATQNCSYEPYLYDVRNLF